MKGWRRYKIELILFFLGWTVYALFAGQRLGSQSSDPHFVYQADAWLHGHLDITPPPDKGDDWAKVVSIETKDGAVHRGRYLQTRTFSYADPALKGKVASPRSPQLSRLRTQRRFRTTRGEEFNSSTIKKNLETSTFMSFPPLPSILMLPQVALKGRFANDVWLTVLIAAFVLPLFYSTLKRMGSMGLSQTSTTWNIVLALSLGFGSVFFYSAIQGRVWFSAHIVGVAATVIYINLSLGARLPFWAGLALGLATLARAPLAFAFPFFALEAWRAHGAHQDYRQCLRKCVVFALPVMFIALLAMLYNYARFDQPFEFGHSYLAVRQQALIEQYGLFNPVYLKRNLKVALALLPQFTSTSPYVHMSGHGMALWITTPAFVALLLSRIRGAFFWSVLVAGLCIATPILFYQNTGWFQFGYRFSLDYTPYLFVLLAVGARRTKPFVVLIALGIVVNVFGALTFSRHGQFYDGAGYDSLSID